MGSGFLTPKPVLGSSAAARRRHAHNCYLLGRQHLENGEWDAARRQLQRALACDPRHVPALRALASAEFTRGNAPEARAYLRRAMAFGPLDGETLFLLGNLELSDGHPREALEAYTRAAEMGDSSPELIYNTALAHIFLGDGGEAERLLLLLVEEQPQNARAWDALGCALRLQKRYADARSAFLQALREDCTLNDARDHLGQMLIESNHLDEAHKVLDAALFLDPQRSSSRHLLGIVLAAQQEFRKAIDCWETVIAQGSAAADTYHLLANTCLQLGERSHAVIIFKELVHRYPDHASGHLQLALLLLEGGDHEHGRRHLERARVLDPANTAVQQLLAAARALQPESKSSPEHEC